MVFIKWVFDARKFLRKWLNHIDEVQMVIKWLWLDLYVCAGAPCSTWVISLRHLNGVCQFSLV